MALLHRAGEIDGYKFEGLKLRLADNTFFTPDFVVFAKDGVVELHDTKGTKRVTRKSGAKEAAPWIEEDAQIKLKLTAELWPFRVFAVFKDGGGWRQIAF